MRHLSISYWCCLLFIHFYLKLFHSYTSIWYANTLVNILIISLHLFFKLFTFLLFYMKFNENSLYCDTWAFWLLLLIILILQLDLLIFLLDSYFVARSVVVIANILTIFWKLCKNSLFCDIWAFLTIMLFIIYVLLLDTFSLLYFCLIKYYSCKHSSKHSYCSYCCLHSILLFYCKFFKILLFLWHLSIFDSSCWLFLFSYLIYSYSC